MTLKIDFQLLINDGGIIDDGQSMVKQTIENRRSQEAGTGDDVKRSRGTSWRVCRR